MVVERNSQDLASIGKRPCDSSVLDAWQYVTRWVVVTDDDGRYPLHDCEAEDFTGMHEAGVQGAYRDHFDVLHNHFDIQADGPEVFFVSVYFASAAEPEL